jgi:ribonuclease Z
MTRAHQYPRFVLVGTGAAANAERCHTCIAVQGDPEHTLLLDTGSGVEVVRHLLRAGVDLTSIRDVFLSHRHSDHVGGLELLLLHCGLRAQAAGRPLGNLAVHGHPLVLEVARDLVTSTGSVAPQMYGERLRWAPLAAGEPVELCWGARLYPFEVDHVPPAGSCWGCVVEVEHHGRVSRLLYSGDTRPTPELVAQARDVDVILHECGGLDSSAEAVYRVGHSTAGDAGRLAAAAGAGRLVLVHLHRDDYVAAYRAEAAQHFGGPVVVGADLDSFSLA